MVEETGLKRGFLALSTLAATSDGGLRGSGNRTEGGQENGRRPNLIIRLALPVPTATWLYRNLHERGAEGTGQKEVVKSFQSQMNENEPEGTQSITGMRTKRTIDKEPN